MKLIWSYFIFIAVLCLQLALLWADASTGVGLQNHELKNLMKL